MNDVTEALKERTFRFAVEVMRLCRGFNSSWDADHVRSQLFRAGTSVAANYHAACRARSRREFIAKLEVVVEESDETVFWLKFADRAGFGRHADSANLRNEAGELLAIFVQSVKTASSNQR
jgi:four helix bundle protein